MAQMTFKFGIENLDLDKEAGRIGIVTNSTGVTQDMVQNVDFLLSKGLTVSKIFSPEHGFYSTFANGEEVPDEMYHGVQVKSLYREDSKEVDGSELADIDTLIFDVQDAGVRFFTYLSTLRKVMETTKKVSTRLIVTDRPNPIRSDIVDGPMLDLNYRSFVGIDRIPMRYGMTIGELARFFDRNIGTDVTVSRMEGYRRDSFYDDLVNFYVPLSWNLPKVDSLINYAGMCLLESVNASVGRGTPHPFSLVGFPGIWSIIKGNFPGVVLRETEFTSLLDPLKGQRLEGYYIHITDREKYDPLKVWMSVLYDLMGSDKCEVRKDWISLLYGSRRLLEAKESGEPFERLLEEWKADTIDFEEIRSEYLLY